MRMGARVYLLAPRMDVCVCVCVCVCIGLFARPVSAVPLCMCMGVWVYGCMGYIYIWV